LGVIIVELAIDSPILADVLDRCPSAEVSLEAETALDDGTVRLSLRGTGVGVETFESVTAADPTVADCRRRYVDESCWFCSIRLDERAVSEASVHRQWVELGGRLLDATGTRERWEVRMRFPSRETFARFHDACRERGIGVEIRSLYDDRLQGGGRPFGSLTPSGRLSRRPTDGGTSRFRARLRSTNSRQNWASATPPFPSGSAAASTGFSTARSAVSDASPASVDGDDAVYDRI
jgi:predicted DNA binding protein